MVIRFIDMTAVKGLGLDPLLYTAEALVRHGARSPFAGDPCH